MRPGSSSSGCTLRVQEDILINVTPRETRVAITGAGVVQEILIERTASRGLVGNICMGRVARVLPGMQSAFVEIGLERAAFLHVADIWEHRKANGEPTRPIEKILAEGEPVLVQVLKDPIGSKGARRAAPPQLLYQDLSLAQRVLRDMVSAGTARVIVDSRENFQKLAAFADSYMPRVRDRLEHYTGERPLFDLYNVETEIEKALSRRVELKSGGYLIIDQTEALTTIDVNTGGYVGSRNFDDTIFKTNLEAAQALAPQLPLPNLGGIIILDFIDMQSVEHRAAVLEEFRKALEIGRASCRERVEEQGVT